VGLWLGGGVFGDGLVSTAKVWFELGASFYLGPIWSEDESFDSIKVVVFVDPVKDLCKRLNKLCWAVSSYGNKRSFQGSNLCLLKTLSSFPVNVLSKL
jgi:hypothetical protein